ncbi:phage tail length tape measure family protein [Erythrobacter sp. HA6-11]
MATKIGSLLIRLGLDSGEFKSGLEVSERQLRQSIRGFEKMGRQLQGFGARLSVAVTAPMVAIGRQAVLGFIDQEKAMADVNAALASMGDVSGKTSAQLAAMADRMELNSLFDADIILKEVTANLLTFGNIANEQFDRAQQAAIDMAQRMGTAPKEAAIQLAKALNDPVNAISSLSRNGTIQREWVAANKERIALMVKEGKIAEVQSEILSEVERQVRGSAAAAADATPWRRAQVQIGQAMDKIGEAILPIIGPVADAIASLAQAFASLPEPAQKAIVVAAALAAALGPIAFVVGSVVSAMAPLLGTIKAVGAAGGLLVGVKAGVLGIGAALGPVAIAAAAVYLAWRNWDEIAPRIQPLIDELTALGEGLGLVEMKAGATRAELEKDSGWRTVGQGLRDFAVAAQSVADGIDAFLADWTNFWRSDLPNAIANGSRAAQKFVADMVTGIGSWLSGKLNAIWDGAIKRIETVKRAFFDLYDAVVGNSYVPDMVDGIAREMARLDQAMVNPALEATRKTGDAFREMAGDVRALLDNLFPEAARMRQMMDDLGLLDRAAAAGLITPETRREARFRAVGGGAEAPVSDIFLRNEPIDTGVPEAAQRAAEAMARTAQMARRTFTEIEMLGGAAFSELGFQLRGLVTGAQSLSDALANLALRMADMIFDSGFNALGTAIGIPGFASGTLSAPRGLALVGERGPELVSFAGGERVFNARDTRGMMAGFARGDIHMNVYANDADSFRRGRRQIQREVKRRAG